MACLADCSGRACGDDGCGGLCGTCDEGFVCNEGICSAQRECTPQCEGKSCGPDGCGGQCGDCAAFCNDGVCLDGTDADRSAGGADGPVRPPSEVTVIEPGSSCAQTDRAPGSPGGWLLMMILMGLLKRPRHHYSR
ncbi:MAG: hypothetical protein VX223_12315 [Myxococcota bacterium]|nr:hypothetical protein [Myxococcota bacterium]